MKKIIIFLLPLLLLLMACSETNKVTFKEIQPASLITPTQNSFEIQDNDKGLFTLKWNLAKIILEGTSDVVAGPVLYTVEVGKKNDNFTTKVVLGTSSVDSFVVKNDLLNDVLQSTLGLPDMTANDVEFRVTTSYGDPSLAQNIPSQGITLKIKTNKVPYPQNIYMIGGGIDAGDWNSTNVRTLVGVHSAEYAFFTIIYIKANEWIKFNSKKEWNGKEFGKSGEMDINNIATIGEDSVKLRFDGLYVVYVDLKSKKIEFAPAQGSVLTIGEAFGGWSGVPCTVNNTAKTITTFAAAVTGDLRLYAQSALSQQDNIDWWKMEFVPINGKIEFRGRGDDQARTTINAGQKCTMNFIDLTATIE